MKRIIISIVSAIIITSSIVLVLFELKAQKEQLKADGLEIVDSKILGEKRKLLVHLPKDYFLNNEKKYPVIYALDATSHDKDILIASTILSLAKQIPDIIVVGLVNKNRNEDLTPNYISKDQDFDNLGNADQFLDFIEKEAIPLIEKKYRTSDFRMISGNSTAGLFTFFCMLEKPTLFDAYFCYSPSFWRGNNIIAQKLQESLILNSPDAFLYLSIGQYENEKMKNGFDKVIEILKRSDSTELRFHYNYTQSANHGNNAFYSIPKALTVWNEKR